MNSHTHVLDAHSDHSAQHGYNYSKERAFWLRFQKNFFLELVRSLSFFWLSIKMFLWMLLCLILFIIELPEHIDMDLITKTLDTIKFPILVFLVGTYLTLLPLLVVIILIVVPKKITVPFLGISAVLSLIILFAR